MSVPVHNPGDLISFTESLSSFKQQARVNIKTKTFQKMAESDVAEALESDFTRAFLTGKFPEGATDE